MNNILSKQLELLNLIKEKHGGIHPNKYGLHYHDKGTVIQYIKDNAFFLNEEIVEVMLAIGNNDRAIIKPWTERHKTLVNAKFEPDDKVKSEAIDMLCFCINICLAVGITPDNIEDEYNKVWSKNVNRQQNNY